MAREISPASLRVLKAQLYADLVGGLDAAATFAERAMVRMVGEPDFAEGVAALTERRPPHFA
jgi:enoyl-CoA hydratase/carnithine racemase